MSTETLPGVREWGWGFSAEILIDWEAEKRDQFEDRWPIVKGVLAQFRQYGMYLSDVKPGNIMFRDE